MLSDDELHALRDIERRLRWHNPELVRLFNGLEPQPEANHRQRARTRMIFAAAALTGLTLIGPRMLTEAEIRAQQRRPLPQTAPSATTRGAGPVCGPASAGALVAVEIVPTPPTVCPNGLCRAA